MTETVQAEAQPRDFDFWMGRWHVHNRVLRERLAGCEEWDEFEATSRAWPILDGLGNQDEFRTDHDGGFVGMSFRFFDPKRLRWSIYWADTRRSGVLDPPVFGSFSGDVGVFMGHDTFAGRAILVRFTWSGVTTPTPRWEQAFSDDGGGDLGDELGDGVHPDRRRARERHGRLRPRREAGQPRRALHGGSDRAEVVRHRPRRRARPGRDPRARADMPARGAVHRRDPARRRRARVRDPPPLRPELLLPPRLHVAQRERALGDRVGEGRPGRGRRSVPWPADGTHRPTFCVWELGAVCHERQAWSAYLRSRRDAPARAAYVDYAFTGDC